jgi:hypothetical protein
MYETIIPLYCKEWRFMVHEYTTSSTSQRKMGLANVIIELLWNLLILCWTFYKIANLILGQNYSYNCSHFESHINTNFVQHNSLWSKWYGNKPSLVHVKVFACTIYVHIPKELASSYFWKTSDSFFGYTMTIAKHIDLGILKNASKLFNQTMLFFMRLWMEMNIFQIQMIKYTKPCFLDFPRLILQFKIQSTMRWIILQFLKIPHKMWMSLIFLQT